MVNATENLIEEVMARMQLRHVSDQHIADCGAGSELQQRMVEALTQSSQSLFETMCGFAMKPTGVIDTPNHKAQHELNGIISISGKLKVTCVLSLSRELTFNVVKAFVGSMPTQVDADVIDVVGEMTNMVCGNAKERLTVEGLSLGLPTVVSGSSMIVAFESGLKISQLDFTSDQGAMSILFGLRGQL